MTAVEANNVDIVQLFLNHGADVNEVGRYNNASKKPLDIAFTNRNPEMIKVLLVFGADKKLKNSLSKCYEHVRGGESTEEELRLMECITLIGKDSFPPLELNDMLKHIANASCSVRLASFLVNIGADVNWREVSFQDQFYSNTPLHIAAFKTSKRAAEFMKFLLQSGADPNAKRKNGKNIREMRGPRNILKWLGMSWDEMVESVQAERQAIAETTRETLVVR